MKHLNVVAIIVRNATRDKYLVFDHIKGNMITMPIGKVGAGETFEDAAKRELREETGLEALSLKLYGVFDNIEYNQCFNDSLIGTTMHIYECEYSGTPKNTEPSKHRDMFWMGFDEIIHYEGKMSYPMMYLRDNLKG